MNRQQTRVLDVWVHANFNNAVSITDQVTAFNDQRDVVLFPKEIGSAVLSATARELGMSEPTTSERLTSARQLILDLVQLIPPAKITPDMRGRIDNA